MLHVAGSAYRTLCYCPIYTIKCDNDELTASSLLSHSFFQKCHKDSTVAEHSSNNVEMGRRETVNTPAHKNGVSHMNTPFSSVPAPETIRSYTTTERLSAVELQRHKTALMVDRVSFGLYTVAVIISFALIFPYP